MIGIRISSNWKAVDREFARLKALPGPKAKAALDSILATGFKATQGAVHVITGSLKSSGKSSSEVIGDEWHGEISYGGISLGINNPVTYAIYEKARDEHHDFFAPLKALDSLYIKALLKLLEK
jgi:hypothetical protein